MAVIKHLEEKFKEGVPNRELVYEDDNAKVIRFYLKQGQEIKPHTSPSSVFISVIKGRALFHVEGKNPVIISEGGTVFYEPKELHGFKAMEDSVIQAVITPNPSANKVRLT